MHNIEVYSTYEPGPVPNTFRAGHFLRPCAWYCLSCLPENWYCEVVKTYISGHLFVTSLLSSIYSPNPWVLFFNVGVRCCICHLPLLDRQVYSVSRLCLDQSFLSLCHRRHVARLCMLYKVNSNSNHCFFSEIHPLLPELYIPSCDRSSSIVVWSVEVKNLLIYKVFPSCPG